jgi:hypothetical protein
MTSAAEPVPAQGTVARIAIVSGVLAAVGGAFHAQLLAIQVDRSSDPAGLPELGRNIEFLGTRVFLPASILLFIAGVLMTMQRWASQQTWISRFELVSFLVVIALMVASRAPVRSGRAGRAVTQARG